MSIIDFIYDINPWLEGIKLRYRFKRFMFYHLLESIRNESRSIAYILIGLRRTGKTVILQQLAEELTESGENAVYIQVEDALLRFGENSIIKTVEAWISHSKRRRMVVFLDEVQYDPKWSLQVKVMLEKARSRGERTIFICSGSSALGTLVGASESLSGRAKILRLYPMGLLEILGIEKDIDIFRGKYDAVMRGLNKLFRGRVQEAYEIMRSGIGNAVKEARGLINNALIYGGLPETYDMIKQGAQLTEIRSRLTELVDLIIMKDIIRLQKLYPSRYEITPDEALKIFRIIVEDSPGLATSNSIATETGVYVKKVELALSLFEYSGLIGVAKQFAKSTRISERKRIVKLFSMDIGIRNAFKFMMHRKLLSNYMEVGRIFENLMLIQGLKLTHFFGNPYPEINFWRMRRGGYDYEVDLVLRTDKIIGIEVKKGKKSKGLEKFLNYMGESEEVLAYTLNLDELSEDITWFLI